MAVEKDYFLELGGYDMEMAIFGGESLEFSFLVWMCGGRIKARIYLKDLTYLLCSSKTRFEKEIIRGLYV